MCFLKFQSIDAFRIGKRTKVLDNTYQITLFNYKLDIKTESITDDNILFNFGNIGIEVQNIPVCTYDRKEKSFGIGNVLGEFFQN
jgi:hypothetical protein